MLPEFPDPWEDEKERRKKDFWVAKSPLIRAFMDYDALIETPVWIRGIKESLSPVIDEMEHALDSETMHGQLEKSAVFAKERNVFERDFNGPDGVFLITAVTAMGYVLEDEENVNLFYGDTYELLVNTGVMRNTYEGAGLTLALMKAGADWRQSIEDVPPEFRNFKFDLD